MSRFLKTYFVFQRSWAALTLMRAVSRVKGGTGGFVVGLAVGVDISRGALMR